MNAAITFLSIAETIVHQGGNLGSLVHSENWNYRPIGHMPTTLVICPYNIEYVQEFFKKDKKTAPIDLISTRLYSKKVVIVLLELLWHDPEYIIPQ